MAHGSWLRLTRDALAAAHCAGGGSGLRQVESKRVARPMPDGGMIDRAKTLTLPGQEIDRRLLRQHPGPILRHSAHQRQ